MLTIHADWSSLRKKLQETDLTTINKRVGKEKTLVIELKPLEYDPKIPIFTDKQLERWLKRRKLVDASSTSSSSSSSSALSSASSSASSSSASPAPSSPAPSSPAPSSPAPSSPAPSSSAPSSPAPPLSPAAPSRSFEIGDKGEDRESPALSSGSSVVGDKGEESPRPSPSLLDLNKGFREVVFEGNIDSLVLNEPIDDEYAQYDDDDIETEFSKNLKKIRPDIVKPKVAPHLQPPPPPPITKHQPPAPPTPSAPKPKTPLLPDWSETSKQLQSNNFSIVLKDLTHFKSDIKSSEAAKSLLKDFVMKCIQCDETHYLADAMTLVYDSTNSLNDDIEFGSEFVGRIKRKLNVHTTFKNKINPEQIYQNYQRILMRLRDHTHSLNITLKLPFLLWLFLYDPFTNSPLSLPAYETAMFQNKPNVNSSINLKPPLKTSPGFGVTTKSESLSAAQQVAGPNLRPNSKRVGGDESMTEISSKSVSNMSLGERGENIDPTVIRHVAIVQGQNGCPVFKIAAIKSVEKIRSFRKRL